MHKTKLVGDPETFTLGLMQLFDTKQPQIPFRLVKKPKKGAVTRFAK